MAALRSAKSKRVRLALALSLCAVAAVVVVWRLMGSREVPVDPEVVQKQRAIEANIQAAAPPAAPEPEIIHRSRKGGPINPK
jgi:hypothetical protein